MALGTGGTSTTTALSALRIGSSTGGFSSQTPANYAAFNALCKDWIAIEGTTSPPTATLTPAGLFIPDRGLLSVYNGDVVMVDPTSGVVVIVPAVAFTVGSPKWVTSANT